MKEGVRHPGVWVLWGKSGTPAHSLVAHSLDTAAVALALMEREPARTRAIYTNDFGMPEDDALSWCAFLVSLHDLGKASPIFQASWADGAARVEAAGLRWDPALLDSQSVLLCHNVLTEVFLDDLLRGMPGFPRQLRWSLARGLGAHHGFAPTPNELKIGRLHLKAEAWEWKLVRLALVNCLRSALSVSDRAPVASHPPLATLRVMALASFADWLASDPSFFPRGRDPSSTTFWQEARHLAEQALDGVGWRPRRPLASASLPPFGAVFDYTPNALQETVAEAAQRAEKPVLILVEAPMGQGKTEAALYAHVILQQRLGHRGLYVALPTQATGNGLFPRVRSFLERFSTDELVDLQLQHGAAVLNPEFQALRPTAVGERDEGVVAGEWFSAKKRAMLSEYGVGTLDQALLGVLKVRHHFVRLWGLMNRTVVLDEIHAYDTYTSGLLQALLHWLKKLDSSVIVMTATLPSAKRREMLSVWGEVPGDLGTYPRVVVADGSAMQVLTLPSGAEKTVQLEAVPVAAASLASLLHARLPGTLGAIVNTVDRAQTLYQALGEGEILRVRDVLSTGPVQARHIEASGSQKPAGIWSALERAVREAPRKADVAVGKRLPNGTRVFLLHARFPAEERVLREQIVLSLFGKEGPRPEQAILVATQVVEQSLDLDFDLLYSDLAPVDLLFQRAGRLQRHSRERPTGHLNPVLLVGQPPEPAFGSPLHWSAVYEEYVLLSTWLALRDRREITLPSDMEDLLEEVYERSPDAFPEELRAAAAQAFLEMRVRLERDRATARNLGLFDPAAVVEAGRRGEELPAYLRLDDDVEEGRTQRLLTRLGDPSVSVVPVFRIGDGLFLDSAGMRPLPGQARLAPEEVRTVYERMVRLSRRSVVATVLGLPSPPGWARHSLTRDLRPLDVGSVCGDVRVTLDPQLGVVYQRTA